MRHIIFFSLVFWGSLGFAASWNASVIREYSKAKTYKELLCLAGSNSEVETCRFYEKELGATFLKRPARISLENAETIFLKSSTSQVRLSRSGNVPVYALNGHKIDLRDVQTLFEFRSMIQKALPKKSAQRSFWISNAEAAVGSVDPEILASIEAIIKKVQKFDSCDALYEFVSTCINKSGGLDQAIIQTDAARQSDSLELKEGQKKAVQAYLKKMDRFIAKIEKQKVPFLKVKAKQCNSLDPALASSFEVCIDTFKTYGKALRIMSKQMDLQRVNQTIDDFDEEHSDLETPYSPARQKSETGTK